MAAMVAGITVSMPARNAPRGTIFGALFFGARRDGSATIQLFTGIPCDLIPTTTVRHSPLRDGGAARAGVVCAGAPARKQDAGYGPGGTGVGMAMKTWIQAPLKSPLAATAPILFAAVGGIFARQAGVLNIGIEGMMLGGAFAGVITACLTGNVFFAVLAASLTGALMTVIFCVLVGACAQCWW